MNHRKQAQDLTIPGMRALAKCGAFVLACDTEPVADFLATLTPEEQNALQVMLDHIRAAPDAIVKSAESQATAADMIGPLLMDPLVTNEELGRQMRLYIAKMTEKDG